MAAEAEGKSGADLAKAFKQGVVQRGDVLEVTTPEISSDQIGRGKRFLYLGVDPYGWHLFFPPTPFLSMRGPFVERDFTSWVQVGHVSPEEWNARVDEIDHPIVK